MITVEFYATNLTDDTADQSLYRVGSTWLDYIRMPWSYTLVGVSAYGQGGKAAATVIVHDATSTFTKTFTLANTQLTNISTAALGVNVNDNTYAEKFVPLVDVAGVDANTLDVHITFYFMRSKHRYTETSG